MYPLHHVNNVQRTLCTFRSSRIRGTVIISPDHIVIDAHIISVCYKLFRVLEVDGIVCFASAEHILAQLD